MPGQGAPREVRVRLGARSYAVLVGDGLLATLGAQSRRLFPRPARAFVIADDNLPAPTIDLARDALRGAGWRVELATVSAREELKSLATLERLLAHMAAARLERSEPVVALGGGVTGDLAGFAAAVYRRGVPVLQCPTSLLAMVDASVGGKCGVNLQVPSASGGVQLRKNMVGAFHQPALVVCDVGVLDSLPDDELACGLAECTKHALIGAEWGDPGLMEWTAANAAKFLARDRAALSELVARNVTIKTGVVEGDEREERADGQGRMCLNMGHTVGHAIETMDVHAVIRGTVRRERGLKHGEAVALGLIAESVCGEELGVTRAGLAGELRGLMEALALPTSVSNMPEFETVAAAMQDDKKVGGGHVRLAVPTGRGTCEIIHNPTPAALRAGLGAIRT